MSLFGMYQNRCARARASRAHRHNKTFQETFAAAPGYRPILDAAQQMAQLPPMAVNEAELLQN